ncbi:MAG: ABC transporter permease [Gemmatimonadota bacterium]
MRAALWAEFLYDVRLALRQLRLAPGFSLVAILTLALGIGATTTIFSAVDAVVLRPFSFATPERVVNVAERWQDQDGNVSVGNFVDWKARSGDVLERFGAVNYTSFNLAEGDTPERVRGAWVTHDYFAVFGAKPLRGRLFTAEEDQPGNNRVAILSEGLWNRRFAGDAAVVGREIRLGGIPHTVVGIMPERFDPLLGQEELWVPIAFPPSQRAEHDQHYLTSIGLLRGGVTLEQAQKRMGVIGEEMQKLFPQDNLGRSVGISPLTDLLIGSFRQRLFVLLGAVGLVLLIACANVANLLLARGAGRTKELALRAALGAGRGRIVRQLLTENLVLSVLTSVVGVGLAAIGVRVLEARAPQGIPRFTEMTIDARVIAFALLLALISTLVFGLAPALRSARSNLQSPLREGGRGSTGTVRDRLRTTLVAGEVALALTLLVGAGLLIRSALYLQRVEPGFNVDGVLTARVSLPESYSDPALVRSTFERMALELDGSPGVGSASVVSQAPLGVGGNGNGLLPEGRPFAHENFIFARLRVMASGYFETMGMRLVKGRTFDSRDVAGGNKVMVISEALARAAFPDQDPIGKRIACCEGNPDGSPHFKTIVGVMADVRSAGPTVDPAPEFYLPITQVPDVTWTWLQRSMTLVARSESGDANAVAGNMREVLKRIDPSVPLYLVQPASEQLRASMAQARFNTLLLGSLGFLGLVLAVIGIYSVIAYFVSLRLHEIGVRMALGATTADVLRLMTLQGSIPVLAGMAVGTIGAFASTRLLRSSLFGVQPGDPLTFIAVMVLLGVAGLIAIVIPARRATRVDPARTLQSG